MSDYKSPFAKFLLRNVQVSYEMKRNNVILEQMNNTNGEFPRLLPRNLQISYVMNRNYSWPNERLQKSICLTSTRNLQNCYCDQHELNVILEHNERV